MAAIFKTSQQDSINHSLQSLSVNIKLYIMLIRKTQTLDLSGHRKNVYLHAIDKKYEICHLLLNLSKVLIILRFEFHS